MPPLNWDAFASLPGSVEGNFEMLCRGLVRRHYARHGDFRALAAQPGVEFHLRLRANCTLGDAGRWYGWQCRWYNLPGDRALGATRRKKIAAAIAQTEKVLPDLTDWVLWTQRTLTKGDQKWFYGLKTRFQRHLWTAAEVEEHLSGDGEILRGTYFGDLILTPATLASVHDVAVAPVRRRWQPEVHQTIDAERQLRRMLAEPGTWDDVRDFAHQLRLEAAAADRDLGDLAGPVAEAAAEVARTARELAVALVDSYIALGRGELDLLHQQLATRPRPDVKKFAVLPRRLRAIRHKAALSVTNALAGVCHADKLLEETVTLPGTRLISVVADAGCGKTELAAQLTSASGNRPAGILLHGRNLQAGGNLDDLARSVAIHGAPVACMEALAAAVDAAGERAHRRLPIVIDGLNEAEDPRNWKSPLTSLTEVLLRYPYVLVVCTLRTPFADEALPDGVGRFHIPHFEHDTTEAVRKYFNYYRINAGDAELPWELLRHPLTLRLFCEVTNPGRQRTVGIEAMPSSLTGLFDLYLKQASDRIAELAPRRRRFYAQDVRAALAEIGWALWEEGRRSLGFIALRRRLGDDSRSWNESIVRALEQDGILLRDRPPESTSDRVAILFDALAGHLVADSILTKYGWPRIQAWLRHPHTVSALAGPVQQQHPLASDISRALVGMFPRKLHRQQLWPHVQEPLRSAALFGAASLEGAYLDAATVSELATWTAQPPSGSRDLFDRLWHTRSGPEHPLNTEFLDGVLRPMSVAQRDLRWTEWVRKHSDKMLRDLKRLEDKWHSLAPRSPSDRLRAMWVMWTLTSTVREIRDQATLTLYWFGRGEPAALFSLTLDALGVNDPCVPERLLGASYGVAMARQLPDPDYEKVLCGFLTGLRSALTGPGATHPTYHWLARLYVQGCVTLALAYHPGAVPRDLHLNGQVLFAAGKDVEPIAPEDSRSAAIDQALNRHYDDDTLGDFVGFRRGCSAQDRGEHSAVAHLRGTLWTLGWREASLGVIDKNLPYRDYRAGPVLAERYAKKYAWIGLYTYPAMLDHYRRIWDDRRPPDVQIDPSFPNPTPPAPISIPAWVPRMPADDRRWIRHGIVAVPDELLYRSNIGSYSGPWVAADGYLSSRTKEPERGVFGFLSALLVNAADADRLVGALNTKDYPGDYWLPKAPEDHYIFSGEIPWHPQFARGIEDGEGGQMYRDRVEVEDGSPIEVEILAHSFGWERYHSQLNQAGGASVPSRLFSRSFDLRGIPQSFDQRLPDGTRATISLGPPAGFDGHLLYLREDLVQRYAAGRRLVWFIWGERNLYEYLYSRPDWLLRAYGERAHIWRHLVRGEQLSGALKAKGVLRPRRTTRRSPTQL